MVLLSFQMNRLHVENLQVFSNAVGQSKKRLCCSDFVELPLHSKVGAIEVFHYGDEDAGQGEDSFSSPSA